MLTILPGHDQAGPQGASPLPASNSLTPTVLRSLLPGALQGMIKLDRKERSLQLKVQVNSAGAGGARGAGGEAAPVKDLKQLSGGERSYTTVRGRLRR